jgi:hypothetical protein
MFLQNHLHYEHVQLEISHSTIIFVNFVKIAHSNRHYYILPQYINQRMKNSWMRMAHK